MLILSHKGLDNFGGIVFQGFLLNALELNHAFLSQGCTRQRRGQMEPSPSLPHLGRGQPQRGAQGSAWSAGSPAGSPGDCSQPSHGALVSSHLPTDRNGGKSKRSLYCMAIHQGTSTLTATLNTFKGHNSSPLKH